MKKKLRKPPPPLRASDFCLLRCGPAQASPLRSEASRALRYGDKNRRPVPKGD